jgi:hypothetical protein
MITLIAFVVVFGLGACVVKLVGVVRRALRASAAQQSGALV